jgi:hypothetical protein
MMRLLESYNPYPDCVLLHLETTIAPANEPFDLYLNLRFGEQWQSLLDGRIKFALKGGKLKLKLEGGEFSSVSCDLGEQFPVATTISQTDPMWHFLPKPSDFLLQGVVGTVKLGTIAPTAKSYCLAATFEISRSDLSLTDAEGLWRHDISPNKHGILERAIALLLRETCFAPYLCWMQLGAIDNSDWQPLVKENEAKLSQDLLSLVKQTIERIYESPTDNFLELAVLAGLNPLTDLAGGNFLAANLSGSDLNGANLSRTNFRGANLTDADLSEANLSYARLSGADLSGAYLGNANLSHADLHRSSLALANAIAADFTGADLREANLSNTNLSGATVGQARFGNNTGLSEEMKLSLSARGATVE